jgi:hypothetical protein
LLTGPGRQQGGQGLQLAELLNPSHIPDVFAEQLVGPQGLPPAGEADVPFDERLRISAVSPQGRELVWRNAAWGADDPIRIGQVLPGDFGHREGVHTVQEIPSHQAVPATTVNVHPGAAGDQDAGLFGIGVEKPLEELLPPAEFVQLVEQDGYRCGCERLESQPLGDRRRSPQYQGAVIPVVPIEVHVGQQAAGCGFAYLARAADHCHLPVRGKVVCQRGVIESSSDFHSDHFT